MPDLLGVDLGGTYIKAHAFTMEGQWRAESERQTPQDGADAVAAAVAATIFDLQEKLSVPGIPAEFAAVGIGIPGTLSADGRSVRFAPNLCWHDVPFAQLLENQTGLPVFLENDANLAAMGENWQGAGTGVDDLICITVGTGIGGGIILDGQLLVGKNHNAAEVGHMVIQYDGLPCGCGNRGCWEQYASTTALVRRVQAALKSPRTEGGADPCGMLRSICDNNPDAIEGKHIIEAVRQGDPLARHELAMMIEYLATGLSNLVFLFNPARILLVGGILAAAELILPPLDQRVRQLAPPASTADLMIATGALGNRAGSYGAACLARKAVTHG